MRFLRSGAVALGIVLTLTGVQGYATTQAPTAAPTAAAPLDAVRPPERPDYPSAQDMAAAAAAAQQADADPQIALQVPPEQDIPQATPRRESPERGPVTNLPLPRFVSLKTSTGYARRGPSRTHKIDWVYTRKDQPLEITAEFGHWRQIRDHEGLGGWVHYALLSGVRTVLVEADEIVLHSRAADNAPQVAKLERGVVAKLGDCTPDWCRLSVSGYKGWAHKAGLWGVEPDEIRD